MRSALSLCLFGLLLGTAPALADSAASLTRAKTTLAARGAPQKVLDKVADMLRDAEAGRSKVSGAWNKVRASQPYGAGTIIERLSIAKAGVTHVVDTPAPAQYGVKRMRVVTEAVEAPGGAWTVAERGFYSMKTRGNDWQPIPANGGN